MENKKAWIHNSFICVVIIGILLLLIPLVGFYGYNKQSEEIKIDYAYITAEAFNCSSYTDSTYDNIGTIISKNEVHIDYIGKSSSQSITTNKYLFIEESKGKEIICGRSDQKAGFAMITLDTALEYYSDGSIKEWQSHSPEGTTCPKEDYEFEHGTWKEQVKRENYNIVCCIDNPNLCYVYTVLDEWTDSDNVTYRDTISRWHDVTWWSCNYKLIDCYVGEE